MLRYRPNSLFYKFLVSYIVLFATPLVILGGIFYQLNAVNSQRDVLDANQSKLTQVRSQIDLQLKSLQEVVYHISTEDEIYRAVDPADREGLVVPQLVAYKEHYPFINDIMFYYRGDSRIYLSSGMVNYNSFETILKKDQDWTGASFFSTLNSVSAPKAKRIISKEVQPLTADDTIAFMYPVPYLEKIPQATMLFTLNESELLSVFQNIVGDLQGMVLIYDPYYQLLVSYQNGLDNVNTAGLEERLRSWRGTGLFQLDFEHKDYVLTRMVSNESNWSYLIAMPKSYVYASMLRMRELIIGSCLLLLLLGLFGAILFSKRNYRPIKALVSSIVRPDDELPAGGKNELEVIRHSIDWTVQRNKEMIVQMNAQRPFIKDQCLLTLLRGRTIDASERDYLIKCSNLMLDGDAYYCMAVAIQQKQDHEPDLDSLVGLLDHLLFVGGRGYGVEIVGEHYVAVIVVLQETPENGAQKQIEIAGSLVALAREKFGHTLAVGIGNLYTELDRISSSYLEAAAVLFDNQINRNKSIHLFDRVENHQEQVQWYPIKEQALFIQSLKQGDEKVALETLKTLIEKITAVTTSFLLARCLCFDIVNYILKSLNKWNDQSFSAEIRELLKFNTLQEFHTGLEELTVLYCKQQNSYMERKRKEQKNRIISFINNHFKDSLLSLDRISEEFGLSVSYLGRFIKEETGVTFIEYLTNLRINEAKMQLQKTDKLVQDIVLDIGYLNVPSFVRKFKSLEGVTPGQYREIVGNS